MIYVIGSGPSGIACSIGLLDKGQKVTMLDVGTQLDTEKRQKLRALKDDLIDRNFKHPFKSKLNADLLKLVHNSDFPYRVSDKYVKFFVDGTVDCIPSFARGGLSNVWGAAVEKFTMSEFEDWPINYNDIASYYTNVFKILKPMTERGSDKDVTDGMELSEQAFSLLQKFYSNTKSIRELGISFSPSILAADFTECVYCGACMHGCPKDLIYRTPHTLKELIKNKNFKYLSGVVVENLAESESEKTVKIHCTKMTENRKKIYIASRVYLACGAAISTLLVSRSTKQVNKPILLRDSSHITLPAFMFKRIPKVSKKPSHALAQIFLKVNNSQVCDYPVHISLYTYMDLFEQKILSLPFGKHLLSVARSLLERLIVLKIHLHSSSSHQFTMTLSSDDSLSANLNGIQSPQVNRVKNRLLRFLRKNKNLMGFIPIPFTAKVSQIGRSFHYGASFPMSKKSSELTSDIYGRPLNLRRVHLVDASSLPTVPAGSITATIMANAYRIGDSINDYQNE